MAAFKLTPLGGNFGKAVTEIDLPALTDAGLVELLQALYANRFLVIETGGLSKADYIEFARRVGKPILYDKAAQYPEIIPISNVGVDTEQSGKGAAHWHTDQSFREEISSATMLYSLQAPKRGGETLFCDLAAAYDALPATLAREIEDLVVEHRHGVSVAARPGDHTPVPPRGWDQRHTVYHPLVRRHPVTGQKTLYAITGTSQGIRGMDRTAATRLLHELCDHAFQERFIASHAHRVHDLVIWDNPTTMHSATPLAAATGPDDTREIDRISVRGLPSVLAGAAT